MRDEVYDVVIIGAGPAGLTAGLYCAQGGLKVVAVEKEKMGGQILDVEKIENYPGFPEGVTGVELGVAMVTQATSYGLEIQLSEVEAVSLGTGIKRVKTGLGDIFGKTLIIAGGAAPQKLGAPGEEKFAGKGVAYCAMCEGGQFAGKSVVVAGAGNSGLTEALYLTKIVSKVTVIEALPECNALAMLQKRARDNNIEIICNTRIEAILGDDKITGLRILNTNTGEGSLMTTDGVLVHVGLEPRTSYIKGVISLNGQGQILINEMMETSIPGVYAAGDIRHGSPRQVAAAIGDGTIAALAAQKFVREVAD